jgi:hypothetical protein
MVVAVDGGAEGDIFVSPGLRVPDCQQTVRLVLAKSRLWMRSIHHTVMKSGYCSTLLLKPLERH